MASKTTQPQVLLIGLDSADAELIKGWMEEGHLPTLESLRRQGLWSRLRTTAEVMHVSAWPSIYTGTTPGVHGLYHAYQVRAGRQGILRTEPSWCARPPFWKYLDDAGRRCIVMDAFMDCPLEGFRGVQILEYGTWTWFGSPGSSPPAMRREIERRFGRYPGPEHSNVTTVPRLAWFRDRLAAGAETKAKVVRWLLREHPWDFAFITFGEPHGAGHYLWHVDDRTHPSHPAARSESVTTPLRDVYIAVDRAIGEIVNALDDRATLLIVAGDGMGPNYACSHHVPEILTRLGLSRSADRAAAADRKPVTQSLSTRLRGAIPLSVRQSITRCLPRLVQHRLSMKWVNGAIDWEASQAYCIPNANEAYLRVNLQGRELKGRVEGGARYQEIIEILRGELGALVNPRQDLRSVVAGVFETDYVFAGPERPHLPDLVVTWDARARAGTEIEGPRSGRVCGVAAHQLSPFYTGNHRPNAFVLARGLRIDPETSLGGRHIVDLAPTILAELGVDPPGHFEGRSLAAGAPAPA